MRRQDTGNFLRLKSHCSHEHVHCFTRAVSVIVIIWLNKAIICRNSWEICNKIAKAIDNKDAPCYDTTERSTAHLALSARKCGVDGVDEKWHKQSKTIVADGISAIERKRAYERPVLSPIQCDPQFRPVRHFDSELFHLRRRLQRARHGQRQLTHAAGLPKVKPSKERKVNDASTVALSRQDFNWRLFHI